MRIMDNIAIENGYKNKTEMLWDYGFAPTVRIPKHKKVEIIPLFWRYFKSKSITSKQSNSF